MTLVFALPLIAGSVATPSPIAEAVSILLFASFGETTRHPSGQRQCGSQFLTADALRGSDTVWRRGGADPAPLMLYTQSTDASRAAK